MVDHGSSLDDADLGRLNQVAGAVENFTRALASTHHATPRNLAAARQEVVASIPTGRIFTPSLVYPDGLDPRRVRSAAARVRDLTEPAADRWDRVVADHVATATRGAEAVRSHDGDKITFDTLGRFGDPSGELLEFAEAVLDLPHAVVGVGQPVSVNEVCARFHEGLAAHGVTGWRVEVSDALHARVAVNPTRQRIRVSSRAELLHADVERLVVHEIGTHVLRRHTALAQPLRLLAMPFGVSEPTEEGLAVLNEARCGVLDLGSLRTYALRVVAAHTAMSGSFVDVVEHLLAYTTPQAAVAIAFRTKRGFADLSSQGSHLKDLSYLSGYLVLVRHLRRRPDDHPFLMVAKQPLANLPLVRAAVADGRARLPHPPGVDGGAASARQGTDDPFGLMDLIGDWPRAPGPTPPRGR